MKNINRILFYIEPFYEISEDFRLGTFLHYHYLAKNLSKCENDIDVRFLMSDTLHHLIMNNNQHNFSYKTYTLNQHQLNNIVNHSADFQYKKHQQIISNNKTYQRIKNLIKEQLTNDWQPDVIMMHDTHAPFLQSIFPNALVLHGIDAMGKMPPYPQMYVFDHFGLYNNSILTKVDLDNIYLSEDDKNILFDIKNWYAKQITIHDPTWGIIEQYQAKFDKLVLLPLQLDNYFPFHVFSSYDCQLALVEQVLENTPKDWGVIVVGFNNYSETVGERFEYLRKKYPNLIQRFDLDKIPAVTQCLMPHIDAVVALSSYISYQTLLFNKPLICVGQSDINRFASCDLENIATVFDNPYPELNHLKLLKFLFRKYCLLHKTQINNYSKFYDYLNTYYQNYVNNQDKQAILLPDIYPSLLEFYHELTSCHQQEIWLATLTKNQIEQKPNPVFIDIVHHDVISWDLFDTLVDRPFIHPHELFQAMEDKIKDITQNFYIPFHMLRIESEHLARTTYHREISFDEIYDFFEKKTNFPKNQIELIKKLEIDMELSCIHPRKLMKRTWEFAGVLGKPRSIITDIYLDKTTIETIVKKNGYTDYEFLLISSVERIRKEDGTIYPLYLKEIKKKFTNKTTFLHIGDNPRADGEMARKFGITSHVIPKAIAQFYGSYYTKLLEKPLQQNCYDTSVIIGLIANKLFSSPKSYFNYQSVSNQELYNVGYSVLGVFIVSYVQWVIRRLRNHQIEKVLFLARDAHLIMKTYELFKELFEDLPNYDYLLCSRRGVVVPSIASTTDILETALLDYGITSIKNFINSRFGLQIDDIPAHILQKHGFKLDGSTTIQFPLDIPTTNAFVLDIQDIILNKSKSERVLYQQYLTEIGIHDDKKMAMVDIGYSGTIQRKITSMTDKSFVGLYMLTQNQVLPYFQHENFEGWLASYDNQRSSIRSEFNEFIPLLESMLSSDEGSFVNFYLDEQGKRQINYLYSEEETHRCYFINSIQQGALDFVKDFLSRFGKLSLDINISPKIGSHLMFEFGKNPTVHDVALFEGLLLENMFAGSEFNVIANPYPYLNKSGKLTQESYQHLIHLSKWKQGATIAYQKFLQPVPIEQSTLLNHSQMQPQPTIYLSKKQRLYRKLMTKPELFIEDIKVLPKPIKKVIRNNELLLDITKVVFKNALSDKNN